MQIDNFVIAERYIEREEPDGPFWATGWTKGTWCKIQARTLELLTAIGVTPGHRTEVSRHIRSVPARSSRDCGPWRGWFGR